MVLPNLICVFTNEISRIYHYEPIHGKEKLKRIQILDKEKAISHFKQNIALFIINTNVNKPDLEFYKEISDIIAIALARREGNDPSTFRFGDECSAN